MSHQAVEAFREGIDALVKRMRAEWELTYAECIGVLEMIKMDVWSEVAEQEGDDEWKK